MAYCPPQYAVEVAARALNPMNALSWYLTLMREGRMLAYTCRVA
jgi:hypothetical protein